MSLEAFLSCDHACCRNIIKLELDLYNGVSARLKEAATKGWSFTWKPDNCIAVDKAYCPEHHDA